jgi:hypothetical protein
MATLKTVRQIASLLEQLIEPGGGSRPSVDLLVEHFNDEADHDHDGAECSAQTRTLATGNLKRITARMSPASRYVARKLFRDRGSYSTPSSAGRRSYISLSTRPATPLRRALRTPA